MTSIGKPQPDGGASHFARPAYALAALIALEYVIGTTVQHWGAVSAVLIPTFAVLAVATVLVWMAAVVVDVLGLPASDSWQYRKARRRWRRDSR